MTQNNLGAALFAQGERLDGAEGVRRLEESAAAYRLALEVRTREALPQQWAMTQNNLGAALQVLGNRQGGGEGARRLGESAEAFRSALEVFTRDALPQPWAAIQNNLGNVLFAQGERQGGVEGSRSLAESAAAFRRALEVYTRDAFPKDWAVARVNLGRTLQAQAIRGDFAGCLDQIERLSRNNASRDDPVAGAFLRTLAIVCRIAAGQADAAGRDLDALMALIERQPADFRIAWDWGPLKTFVAGSEFEAVKPRRRPLVRLVDAASGGNRAAILAGLKDAKAELATGAGVPKEAARK